MCDQSEHKELDVYDVTAPRRNACQYAHYSLYFLQIRYFFVTLQLENIKTKANYSKKLNNGKKMFLRR